MKHLTEMKPGETLHLRSGRDLELESVTPVTCGVMLTFNVTERKEHNNERYEDKDGNRRKAVEITVDSVHFCDSKKDGGQSSGGDFADPGYSEGSGDFTENEDNGDLPF